MPEPIVSLRDVSVRVGDKLVLRRCSLDISPGITVILGLSGAGKSTLLKTINLLHRPEDGSIVVAGRDLVTLSSSELDEVRTRIGVVFQSGALFSSLTVFENVALALRELTDLNEAQIREKVTDALERVGLSDSGHLSPDQLSGGMVKRAAIARALALSPLVLLFDEPTTGVDPILARHVLRQIRKVTTGTTLASIIVTHDLEAALRFADHVALLYEGAIVWNGTPQQLERSADPIVRQFRDGALAGPIAI